MNMTRRMRISLLSKRTPLWDSSMSDLLSHWQLFDAFKDDYWMDILIKNPYFITK